MVELSQRLEQRRLLIPQLRQSLQVLALALPEMRALIAQELETNPFLEESDSPKPIRLSEYVTVPVSISAADSHETRDYIQEVLSQKHSLYDVLSRQLAMFADCDEDIAIGQEIIGNVDANGYLAVPLPDIAHAAGVSLANAERVLKLIQQFEPAGVAARTPRECLLIQLALSGDDDPCLKKLIEDHLDDIAKKNFSRIAKSLKESPEKIEALVARLTRLNPKPGREYSADNTYRVVPDITVTEKAGELDITINNEDIPSVRINKDYRALLKDPALDPATKAFLRDKLNIALEMMRSISRRKLTLRKVIETVVSIQEKALRSGLSELKPLTFREVAAKIGMHESTVCRAAMNKYVRLPYGETVPLKKLFSGKLASSTGGDAVSATRIKGFIVEIVGREDKKKPVSDRDITEELTKKHSLKVSRRTVTKYREEMKILSSPYRRQR
jgi:RNA polymerase sigma-54 factor